MTIFEEFNFLDAQLAGINEQVRNNKLNVSDEEFINNVNEYAKKHYTR
jgi:hypothetical protein